jgi:uncharacterized oligopeptide transporter (OPT) family protein
MADQIETPKLHRSCGRGGFSFRLRLLLYITMGVCAVLGIPGLMYPVAWIVSPWFVLAPLILLQFLFILLVPPLRHRLLQKSNRTGSRRGAENAETND